MATAHPFQSGLKGEQTPGIPIRQAEQVYEARLHLSGYQAAGHRNNSIPLCNQRIRADQLFPRLGDSRQSSISGKRAAVEAGCLAFSFDQGQKIAV